MDTGLIPLYNGGPGEKWCRGLDTLAERCEKYYEQGARFAKWRTALQIDVENGAYCIAYAPRSLRPCAPPNALVPRLCLAAPKATAHHSDCTAAGATSRPLPHPPPAPCAGCPTDLAIEIAAQDLARYARICQVTSPSPPPSLPICSPPVPPPLPHVPPCCPLCGPFRRTPA